MKDKDLVFTIISKLHQKYCEDDLPLYFAIATLGVLFAKYIVKINMRWSVLSKVFLR